MAIRFISVCFVLLVAAALVPPALADEGEQVYLLFANTSSHSFHVKGMTVGGKACASCADRTITPGAVTMVKIGDLGGNHLKLAITGDGSGTCNYDFGSDGNSERGDCGSKPKIAYTSGVHSDSMFDTQGTPSFNLFYAYDLPKGQ